jgi:hypothetical protein
VLIPKQLVILAALLSALTSCNTGSPLVSLNLTSEEDPLHDTLVQACLEIVCNGAKVTTVDTDIVWDSDLLEITAEGCSAGSHSRPIYQSPQGSGRMRINVASIEVASVDGVDVLVPGKDSIDDRAKLWCCTFRKQVGRTLTYPMRLENVSVRGARRTLAVQAAGDTGIINSSQ